MFVANADIDISKVDPIIYPFTVTNLVLIRLQKTVQQLKQIFFKTFRMIICK